MPRITSHLKPMRFVDSPRKLGAHSYPSVKATTVKAEELGKRVGDQHLRPLSEKAKQMFKRIYERYVPKDFKW